MLLDLPYLFTIVYELILSLINFCPTHHNRLFIMSVSEKQFFTSRSNIYRSGYFKPILDSCLKYV